MVFVISFHANGQSVTKADSLRQADSLKQAALLQKNGSNGFGKLPDVAGSNRPPQSTDAMATQIVGISKYTLPIIVLLFGAIIILSLMYLTNSKNNGFDAEHAVRLLSIVLIITGILFLVATGDVGTALSSTSSLYAPAFGLMGTMAGYLLGKTFDKPLSSAAPREDGTAA